MSAQDIFPCVIGEVEMAYCIAHAADGKFYHAEDAPSLRQAFLVGHAHGAARLETGPYQPARGATTGWTRTPSEESSLLASRNSQAAFAAPRHEPGSGGYGVTPVRVAHPLSAVVRGSPWAGVRASKSPTSGGSRSGVAVEPAPGVSLGRPTETDSPHRSVGPCWTPSTAPDASLSMPATTVATSSTSASG